MKTKKYSIERGWIRDLKNMEGFTSYESDEEYNTLEEAQKAFEDTMLYLEENEYVFLNVVEYEDGEFYDSTILNEATYANEIIKYAMNRIGTNDINILDGMTLCYNDKYYNIYVNNGIVEIDEV